VEPTVASVARLRSRRSISRICRTRIERRAPSKQQVGRRADVAQTAEFAEAGLEDALQAGPGPALGLDVAVKRRQIPARQNWASN